MVAGILLLPLLELPQPVPNARMAKNAIASSTKLRRFCAEIPSRKKHAMNAPTSLTKNKFGPCGRLAGLKTTPLAAVEATVIVALPEVFAELNIMILGAVKFCPGVPKLQVGGETAPDGELVTAQLRVTEPVNPLAAVTVMSCVPDWPGAEMFMVPVLDDRLIPGTPTLTLIAAEVLPE